MKNNYDKNSKSNIQLLLVALIVLFSSCTRKSKQSTEVTTIEQNTLPSGLAPQPNTTPRSDDAVPSDAAPPQSEDAPQICRDESGQEIANQFLDQNLNQSDIVVDCFDPNGSKIYSGNSKNCFEELTAKFGKDILFPAAQLFPGVYADARAQGAGGQAAFKQKLIDNKCSDLKKN